jgi:thiol-disulfide isomerase/thioredoxin
MIHRSIDAHASWRDFSHNSWGRTIGFVLAASLLVAATGCEPQTRQTAELTKKLEAVEARLDAIESRLASATPTPAVTPSPVATPVVARSEDKPVTPPVKPAVKPGEAPVITVDAVQHDFGTTWIGEKLSHTFTITNTGKSVLDITKVKPGCGCTVAGTYPKTLAPGDSGKFPFTLDSKKLRGKYTKQITISSTDPNKPNLQVSLTGLCKRYVDVSPRPTAYFGRVLPNQEVPEQVITLTSNVDEPLELTFDPPTSKAFDFTLRETQPGKMFELVVKPVLPAATGSPRATLILKTNLEQEKTISILAHARVPQRIEVQPERILIPTPPTASRRPSTTTRRPITITNHGESPIKILEAVASDPALKATVKENAPGKSFIVTVQVPSDYVPPEDAPKLTIKTDDAEFASIDVPFYTSRQSAVQRTSPLDLKGKPVPQFELASSNGKSLTNADMLGKVTVLNYFAPNCGFCKKQLPAVESIREDYEAKGVRFVNVSQTMGRIDKAFSDAQVVATLKSLGAQSELFTDPKNTLKPLFKVRGFPTMFVVGKSGMIEDVNVGFPKDGSLITKLKGRLDALLAGKPAAKAPAAPTGNTLPTGNAVAGNPATGE